MVSVDQAGNKRALCMVHPAVGFTPMLKEGRLSGPCCEMYMPPGCMHSTYCFAGQMIYVKAEAHGTLR